MAGGPEVGFGAWRGRSLIGDFAHVLLRCSADGAPALGYFAGMRARCLLAVFCALHFHGAPVVLHAAHLHWGVCLYANKVHAASCIAFVLYVGKRTMRYASKQQKNL